MLAIDARSSHSVQRLVLVTSAITVAGGLLGGLVATAITVVWTLVSRGATAISIDPVVTLAAAGCSAVAIPIIALNGYRHVPVWRAVVAPTLGLVFGGTAGIWLMVVSESYPVLVLAVLLGAAAALRLLFRARSEAETDQPGRAH